MALWTSFMPQTVSHGKPVLAAQKKNYIARMVNVMDLDLSINTTSRVVTHFCLAFTSQMRLFASDGETSSHPKQMTKKGTTETHGEREHNRGSSRRSPTKIDRTTIGPTRSLPRRTRGPSVGSLPPDKFSPCIDYRSSPSLDSPRPYPNIPVRPRTGPDCASAFTFVRSFLSSVIGSFSSAL